MARQRLPYYSVEVPSFHQQTLKGYSLIETMVAITILLILLGVFQPTLTQQLHDQHISASMHTLYRSLQRARLNAISKSNYVTVCPSHSGQGCDDGSMWHHGWISFLDPLKSGQPSSPSAIFEVTEAQERLHLFSGRRKRTRFGPDGGAYGFNLTVTACNGSHEPLGGLVVSNVGRIRWQSAHDGEACNIL